MTQTQRYQARNLTSFATQVLQGAGLEPGKADVVAQVLVEGDLMGHTTHGLQLLAPYAGELKKGTMTATGAPDVLADKEAAVLWDGRALPGPWLVREAIRELTPRARRFGSASLVIRHSHHIACLAAYLLEAIEQDMLILIASSDPGGCSVAPFGGTKAVFTPNPIAAGIPATSPILIDISASFTTNGMCSRLAKQGRRFPHQWLLDAAGMPTDDPAVLAANPPGTILPLGGLSAGHKGYGLALLIEALTGGLAGQGRADDEHGWGATVFISLHDTLGFGGKEAFRRQMDWIADECRSNPPRPGADAVRVPGDRALALRREQLEHGVQLDASILPALRQAAQDYGVPFPQPAG